MKWVIHLYPKRWRERYEDEFLYVLEKRKLSFKEVIDVFVNAMDARLLNLVEVIIIMGNKISDIMLKSVFKRSLILGTVILLGLLSGYFLSKNTPSLVDISPQMILLIGVCAGLFIGYVVGLISGIMRVIKVTKKEDVFLPTGKLKFDKIER
ncbi:hypothetical protein [Clostridium estertheticum]|uniref:Uncharacterized protein n=1 Tax=Clostridium estertheticum TaxID=238834 RepID=A0AA47I949_9CLOT|nr:hypothetical protein [Clostridium estertheticum]MBU3157631.1 hypothetical protein [Clostridium estertheticum]WAG63248.1 hypothetical protein LL038_24795 [Clostridium estertheticum]